MFQVFHLRQVRVFYPGDIIRIEVYVLDGSGTLDLQGGTGALFMDSLKVIR